MCCTMQSFNRLPQLVLVFLVLGLFASSAPAQSNATKQVTNTFKSGGEDVKLSRYEPCADGKHPTIVLVHGLQSMESSKSALDLIGQKYAARGYAVFVIHYFDRTKTIEKDIGPLLLKFKAYLADDKNRDKATCEIYSAWLDTLRDGLTHIRTQPNVDREARLAGWTIAWRVHVSDAGCRRESADRGRRELFRRDATRCGGRVKKLPPAQVIHGGKDLVVPVAEAQAVKDLAKRKNFHLEMSIFPNAGHMFFGPKGEFQLLDAFRADSETTRFLGEHLKQVRHVRQ